MRTTVAAAVACALLTGLSVAADVQASIKKEVSIPAGGLGPALRALSDERKIHFVFLAEDVQKLQTSGASGSLTIDEALTKLLKGTGLTYQYIDDQTVSILPMRAPSSVPTSSAEPTPFTTFGEPGTAQQSGNSSQSLWSRFRLAQIDTASQPTSASNANAEPKPLALEEVIVTAQKREERLQDVPISISVLGGADLDRVTTQGVVEALRRVPGVATVETGVAVQNGSTQLAIRGVSASGPLFFGSSPIGYYLDWVPFSFVRSAIVPDANAYDLQQVEILRGPQGTLYGSSALNGVVRVLTKDANVDGYEFKARTSLSSTDGGGESYRGDMAVNVPIVEGKVAARAVVGYQHLGGWIDRPNKEDANEGEIRTMRLKLNAQPTENLSVGLSAWVSRSDQDAPSVSDDDARHRSVVEEPSAADYEIYGLKIGYSFSSFSITSMTSYLDYAIDSRIDLGILGVPDRFSVTNPDAKIRAEELILNSRLDGPWRWSLGGMYRDVDDHLFQDQTNYAGLPIRVAPRLAPTDQTFTSESVAVFGEVTREFLDGKLELTGGLRYFEDDVGLIESSRTSGVPPSQLVHTSDKFDALTPRVVLTWHPSSSMTIYGSYAEGFRSGLQQQPSVVIAVPTFEPADPDKLKNYELGLKSELWGGRAGWDAAIYYVDWQDVQQSLTVEVAPGVRPAAIVNGESASGIGAEFALTVEPLDGLTLGINAGWNDLTMDKDVFSGGVLLFNAGDRLNTSPEYTAGASANYAFPLGSSGFEARFAASANYTSVLENRTIVAGQQTISSGESMLIAGTSFSVDSPGHWTTTLYVDNVNNEKNSPFRQAQPFRDWDSRVRPRTIGLQLEYRFGQ